MQDVSAALQEADPAPIKTVLVVEDDAGLAECLTLLLQDMTSYQVMHVFDGFAALKAVRTITPHLILLDYMLPGMDGLQCLDQLRASKEAERTAVILMSTALPEGVQMRGRVQDRTDLVFLEKPFEMDTLLTLIRHILENAP